MKNVLKILLAVMVIILHTQCTEKYQNQLVLFDPTKPVTGISFSPDSGGVGTKLIVKGENFGDDPSIIKVFVNDKEAKVINANSGVIYAVVPARAGTGKVRVEVGSGEVIKIYEFADKFNYEFKKNVSTLCGITEVDGSSTIVDGRLSEARFKLPVEIALDKDGILYVVDEGTDLRKVNPNTDQVSTLLTFSGEFGGRAISSIALSVTQDTLFVSRDIWVDMKSSVGIFTLTRNTGFRVPKLYSHSYTCNVLAVNQASGDLFCNRFMGIWVILVDGSTYPATDIEKLKVRSYDADELRFIFSPDGKTLYVGSYYNSAIWKSDYNLSTKTFSAPIPYVGTVNSKGAKEGYQTDSRIGQPVNMATDKNNNLYIVDESNHCIWKADKDGYVTVFAGVPGKAGYKDGLPEECLFNTPQAIAIDNEDNIIYVADKLNHRIRKISIE